MVEEDARRDRPPRSPLPLLLPARLPGGSEMLTDAAMDVEARSPFPARLPGGSRPVRRQRPAAQAVSAPRHAAAGGPPDVTLLQGRAFGPVQTDQKGQIGGGDPHPAAGREHPEAFAQHGLRLPQGEGAEHVLAVDVAERVVREGKRAGRIDAHHVREAGAQIGVQPAVEQMAAAAEVQFGLPGRRQIAPRDARVGTPQDPRGQPQAPVDAADRPLHGQSGPAGGRGGASE